MEASSDRNSMVVSTFLESSFETWVLLFARFVYRLRELIEWICTLTSAIIFTTETTPQNSTPPTQDFVRGLYDMCIFALGGTSKGISTHNSSSKIDPNIRRGFLGGDPQWSLSFLSNLLELNIAFAFANVFVEKDVWQLKIENFNKWAKMLPWSGHLLSNWCHVMSHPVFMGKIQPTTR